MKKVLIFVLLTAITYVSFAQDEQGKTSGRSDQDQNATDEITATVKSSTRLFKDKGDLTSVILIIPSGSAVTYLDSDSTYMHVVYDSNEGYIYNKQATIDQAPAGNETDQQQAADQAQQDQPEDRYTYLVNKYGSAMADRIFAGKIWKGMNSEMVRDSWGAAEKINRTINNNFIKEEWVYRKTWLYFENNTLVQWGPTQNR